MVTVKLEEDGSLKADAFADDLIKQFKSNFEHLSTDHIVDHLLNALTSPTSLDEPTTDPPLDEAVDATPTPIEPAITAAATIINTVQEFKKAAKIEPIRNGLIGIGDDFLRSLSVERLGELVQEIGSDYWTRAGGVQLPDGTIEQSPNRAACMRELNRFKKRLAYGARATALATPAPPAA